MGRYTSPTCGCCEVREGKAIFIRPLEKVEPSKQINFHYMLIVSSIVLSWCHIASLCFACKSRIIFKQVLTNSGAPFLKDAGKQLEPPPTWDRRFWQVKLYQRKHAEMKTNTSRLANYGRIGVSAPHHRRASVRPSSWPASSDNLAVRTKPFPLDIVGGLSVIFFQTHYFTCKVINYWTDTRLVSRRPCGLN